MKKARKLFLKVIFVYRKRMAFQLCYFAKPMVLYAELEGNLKAAMPEIRK